MKSDRVDSPPFSTKLRLVVLACAALFAGCTHAFEPIGVEIGEATLRAAQRARRQFRECSTGLPYMRL